MPFADCTVLIAEDDPNISKYIARAMESMGFQTEIAPSVNTAIAKLGTADIAIVDLKMNSDGENVFNGNVIIDRWLEERRGPICVFSAYLTGDMHRELLERGVWNTLQKPEDRDALRAVIIRYGTCVQQRKQEKRTTDRLAIVTDLARQLKALNERHRLAAVVLLAILLGSKVIPWVLTLIGVTL